MPRTAIALASALASGTSASATVQTVEREKTIAVDWLSPGRRWSQPFVDAMLPEGYRLHVVLEGISRGFSAVNSAVHAAPGKL